MVRVLIIGAGLQGITTAYYLTQSGAEVMVVDRAGSPAQETSFANGGLITPSQADPWNSPGILQRMVHYLGQEHAPFLLRPRALPGMAPWGLSFLLASRRKPHHLATTTSVRLAAYSARLLKELREQESLQYDQLTTGTLKTFCDTSEFIEAQKMAQLMLEKGGIAYELWNAETATCEVPALFGIRQQLKGAIFYPQDESGDAHLFTRQLASLAQQRGTALLPNTTVQRLEAKGNAITGVHTSQGTLVADRYVLAAGSYSPLLAKGLHMRIPVYPVKGYSVTLPQGDWQEVPTIPLVDSSAKVVLTPMGKRLRIAGTAEFAGYDLTLNTGRARHVLEAALSFCPSLRPHIREDQLEYWTGLRPMTPDGPPILGPTPYHNLYLNTGHGPLGWTMACGSARLVADMILDRIPEVDLAGLLLSRYRSVIGLS